MSEISQYPGMGVETTFQCSTCGKELPSTVQLTHEVACARMQRQNQRAPEAQPIVRQSSSNAIPEPINQQRQQPMPRREDRRIVENKMVTCPNCEKMVREQDINDHMDNECLKNETIPCEFCDEAISMSDYSNHVENCPRREDNHRDQSPGRERAGSERSEPEHVEPEVHNNERDRSPQRGSSQGGFRGFLRNLAGSAASQLLGLGSNNNEQQQSQPQSQPQRQQGGSILSHLFGTNPETPEQIEQRRLQRQQEMQRRRQEEERQREFLEHMFGQPQVPRNMPNNDNDMMPSTRGNGGSRVIRTIERGPGGMVIVRSRVVPANNEMPMFQQSSRPMEVNPLELLLGMMGGGSFGGMQGIGNGEFGMGGGQQEEPQGLDKETIDSLACIKYNKEANKNLDEELRKCPICLDDFDDGQEVKFLWCTHRFHRGCVDQWLEKHTTCPLCKKDFKEAEQGFSP